MIQGSPLSRVNKMLSKQNRTPSPRVGKYEEGGTVGKYGGQMYGLGDWISENKNILADQYVTNVLANLSEEQWKIINEKHLFVRVDYRRNHLHRACNVKFS